MRKTKIAALCVGVVIVLGVVVITALNYSGFCLPEGRYLTKQELIEIGARRVFRFYPPHNYAGFVAEVERPIAYSSFEDFISRNPNCCSLTRTGRKESAPALDHRTLGHFATFVRIEYRVEESAPDVPETTVSYVAITNCGIPWNGIKLR